MKIGKQVTIRRPHATRLGGGIEGVVGSTAINPVIQAMRRGNMLDTGPLEVQSRGVMEGFGSVSTRTGRPARGQSLQEECGVFDAAAR